MKGSVHRWLLALCVCGWLSTAPFMLYAQEVAVFTSFDGLKDHIRKAKAKHDTIVINFWATWCKPCVKELPAFDTLQQRYGAKNVKVLLVSLDMKSKMDTRLLPFLQEQPLTPEVVLLADQDGDEWIPKVDTKWTGDIPFTWMLKRNRQVTHSNIFHNYSELEAFLRR